jgi:DnaJ family protein C protein 28
MSGRDWESWIDQQIREAQERGEFDDLPGKGKPLDLASNPYAHERELEFKVLKDAGYAPEWIELDKAIRGRLVQARKTLSCRWMWRTERLSELSNKSTGWAESERRRTLAGWQQAMADFHQEVIAMNGDIADLNLKVPGPQFQRRKIDPIREIKLVTGEPT